MKPYLSLLLLLLHFANSNLFAQSVQKIFIADTAMRRILTTYKVMQGDSLLTNRVSGWWQVEFKSDYIHDLTGLSYFTQASQLTIQTKQIIEKWEFPPNVTHLNLSGCQNEYLPFLPPKLQSFWLSHSKVKELPKLPTKLNYLTVSDNQLTHLPTLPHLLIFLNYFNNPIYEKTLPLHLKNFPCEPWANCLPLTHSPQMPFDIKNQALMLASLATGIDSIAVNLAIDHSWGIGPEIHKTVYYYDEIRDSFVSGACYDKYEQIHPEHPAPPDKIYNCTEIVSLDTITQILADIFNKKLTFVHNELVLDGTKDSVNLLRLSNKGYESEIFMSCADCSYDQTSFTFYFHNGQKWTLTHAYSNADFPVYDFPIRYDLICKSLDWLYYYRVSHLLLPKAFPQYFVPPHAEALKAVNRLKNSARK